MGNVIRSLPPPTRRIEAVVYDARREAERILEEGREAARGVRASADAEAEELRARAFAEGREEGLASAAEVLAWAAAERDRLLAAAEPEVIRLALEVSARILEREAAHGSAVAEAMARRALAAARERTVVALRVNPEDVGALSAREGELSALVPRASGVALVSDPTIERGGVVVETDAGTIDARLEAQLAVVRRAFAKVRP
jgi:flagellar biosynthesis/type III secretory pathway protein FliH